MNPLGSSKSTKEPLNAEQHTSEENRHEPLGHHGPLFFAQLKDRDNTPKRKALQPSKPRRPSTLSEHRSGYDANSTTKVYKHPHTLPYLQLAASFS